MKSCNSRCGASRRRRHDMWVHFTNQVMFSFVLKGIGLLGIVAGIGGATFFSLRATLHQLTANDCRLGVVAACEALQP